MLLKTDIAGQESPGHRNALELNFDILLKNKYTGIFFFVIVDNLYDMISAFIYIERCVADNLHGCNELSSFCVRKAVFKQFKGHGADMFTLKFRCNKVQQLNFSVFVS